jgi:hypothetical protein
MTTTREGVDVRPDSQRGFERARAVADAVLYEGYLLYPYRASSGKNSNNTSRWQFGVVGPPGAHDAGVGEESGMRTECLLVADGPAQARARLDVRVRFLQLQVRSVDQLIGEEFVSVRELRAGGATWLAWEEAVEGEVDVSGLTVQELLGTSSITSFEIPGSEEVETLYDDAGAAVGRLRRRRWPLVGTLEVACSPLPTGRPDGCNAVQVRLRNTGGWVAGWDRDEALRRSFLGAHVVLSARDGQFLSLLEPPEWAGALAEGLDNHRCWPVLVGARAGAGTSETVLASPIILYDWPEIAADSAGELFDSTEIDEILTLRVMTMTDEEKRQARATDPRARAIVDRCDTITPEALERLHGGSHEISPPTFDTGGAPWWDPQEDASVSPGTDTVEVDGVAVAKGSAVRLHPSRRADAHDMFFAGQTAKVAGVHHDVDGNVHVAVVLDGDPAADLHEWYGRFLYFDPAEIEPLEALR